MTLPSGLWGEGDPLSPTNLNKRNPAGNFPAKTYHVAWATGTGTTQINNAIVNAAAGGYTAVFIDASRLPYDASVVTFNPSIEMTCEHGFTDGRIDINAYGAAPGTVSYAAIQAALTHANQSATYRTVSGKAGRYYTDRPLIVGDCVIDAGQQGFAAGQAAPFNIAGTMAGGPVLLATGPDVVEGLVTSLVTGPGSAYQYAGNSPLQWFNLRDLNTVELNGLSSFGVRGWFKGSGLAQGNIVGSRGRFGFGDAATNAFSLITRAGDGFLQFFHNMTGTGYNAITGTSNINDGNLHYLECNISAGLARVFVDGTLQASVAATGTLIQGVAEDVTVGPLLDITPGQTSNIAAANGIVDSLELGNIAWHTADYTPPTSKHTRSANTLVLLNNLSTIGPCVQAETAASTNCWLYQRTASNTFSGGSDVVLRGVTISSATQGYCIGLIVGPQSYNWSADHLWTFGCRIGILGEIGDQFPGSLNHVRVESTAGRFGIVLHGGIMEWHNIWVQGHRVNIVSTISNVMVNVFSQCDTQAYCGAVLVNQGSGAGWSIVSFSVNTEAGVAADWIGGVSLSGVGICGTWIGGGIETANGKPHLIVYSNLLGMTFENLFFNFSSAPAVMSTAGPGSLFQSVIQFNGCKQFSWIPWSDVPGRAVIGKLGKGTAIAFSATPTFDCSLRDKFELGTLTSNVTGLTITNVTPSQELSFRFQQNAVGGFTVNQPSNVTGVWAVSSSSSAWTLLTGEVALDSNVYITSVVSGP